MGFDYHAVSLEPVASAVRDLIWSLVYGDVRQVGHGQSFPPKTGYSTSSP